MMENLQEIKTEQEDKPNPLVLLVLVPILFIFWNFGKPTPKKMKDAKVEEMKQDVAQLLQDYPNYKDEGRTMPMTGVGHDFSVWKVTYKDYQSILERAKSLGWSLQYQRDKKDILLCRDSLKLDIEFFAESYNLIYLAYDYRQKYDCKKDIKKVERVLSEAREGEPVFIPRS